jgi:hypothetical protein
MAVLNQVEGLEINPAADGYIVYQPARDRVHYLNHTAALVLELCNGSSDREELPILLQQAFDLAEPPVNEVERCIAEFLEEELVV